MYTRTHSPSLSFSVSLSHIYTHRYTNTAIHFAAIYGWTHVIDVLVEYGVNINVVNDAQMTPLHYAVYHNHTAAAW